MSTSHRRLLYDLSQHLASRIDAYSAGCVGASFSAWILKSRSPAANLRQLIEEAAQVKKGARDYHQIAALGFSASCGILTEDELQALKAGIEWVTNRPAYCPSGGFQSFAYDPVALLGIAVGISIICDQKLTETATKWMTSFVPEVLRDHRLPPWKKTLYLSVLYTLNMPADIPQSDHLAAETRIALRRRGALPAIAPTSRETEENQAINILTQYTEQNTELPHCVLCLAAYDAILNDQPTFDFTKPTISAVADLLRRVPEAMRRWPFEDKPRTINSRTAQWHVDNEYHVQSLLYAILRPYISDLKDEENLPSLGQKKPRADLTSQAMRLVVEVKFLRRTSTFQEMIGQVSEDAGLYLKPGSQYDHIIVFVWDDTRSTEQHQLFIQGAQEIRGIEYAIVISRPALMKTSYLDSDENSRAI